MQDSSFLIVFDGKFKEGFLKVTNFGQQDFLFRLKELEYDVGFIEPYFPEGRGYFSQGRIGIEVVEGCDLVLKMFNLDSVIKDGDFRF